MDVASRYLAVAAAAGAVVIVPAVLRAVAGRLQRLVTRVAARVGRHRCALAVLALGALSRPGVGAAEMPPPVVRLSDDARWVGPGVELGRPVDVWARGANPRPDNTYVVVPGDSLWAIACRALQQSGTAEPSNAAIDRLWRRIYAVNRDVIGSNPDLIFPGQSFSIPEVW